MITVTLAAIALVLCLGGWIGVVISERARAQDADLAALVLSEQFLTELDVEADRWRWGR